MDEKRLDELLDDAARTYRDPPAPPLDAIWFGVSDAVSEQQAPNAPGWRWVAIAATAALVIGVAAGRWSVTSGNRTLASAPTPVPEAVVAQAGDPNQRELETLLGRTAVLLAVLPNQDRPATTPVNLSNEGSRLLGTTRLLLDSPIGTDARWRNLLRDLELVLAQVARLEPKQEQHDLEFIQATLDERDIVPRLRSVVADLSASNF